VRSKVGLDEADRLRSQTRGHTQVPDIPDGRLAKQTAVFAVELTGASVTDLKGDGCRIDIVGQHPRLGEAAPQED